MLKKQLISLLLILFITPWNFSAFAGEVSDDELLSMDFNNYAVGEAPTGFTNCEVEKYGGSNALKVNANQYGVSVEVEKFIMGEYCLSFDIASPDDNFSGMVNVAAGGDKRRTLISFDNGTIRGSNNKQVGKVGKNFTTVTVCVNPVKKYFDLYVNKKQVFSKAYFNAVSDKCMSIIFQFTAALEKADIYLDNVILHSTRVKAAGCFVYNPYGYIETPKVIKFTPESDRIYYKTFGTYSQTMALLEGKTAIHMKSGVVYVKGEKYRLENMPYEENGELMVPSDAVGKLLGTDVNITDAGISLANDVTLALGDTTMHTAASSVQLLAAPVEKNGILYLPLRAIAEKGFSRFVYTDDTAVSSGMVIISQSKFNPPDSADKMQVLNNYLFYIRPSWEDIMNDYENSAVYQQHPRVMLTPESANKLREEIKTNEIKKAWFERLIEYSDKIVEYDALKYELRDGVRLMYVSSDFENYMLCLGMAYQLTGDKKYADAAWKHIEAVSEFPDWNPNHPIDVGIMAVGFSVAYDWMYDCWTNEQKSIMEQGVYNNCFYVANETYKGSGESMDGVINAQNFNCICNGGISMSAIAFMDVYPELSARLTSEAVRCLEYMIPNFAPYGMWYEGASYATMTINYTVKMLSTLESTFNDLYCLDITEGFDKAAEFLSYCQSDVSCYNFADAEAGYATTPGLFWLFNHFNIKGMKDTVATSRKYTNNYDSTLTDSLLWYNTDSENETFELQLDKYYDSDDLVTMRNNYNAGQVFAGLKGGRPYLAHEHLDPGSFVFDALGVRWAHDMGKDNYNLPGYATNSLTRFNIFRLRAAAHNTLVINPTEEPEFVLGERAEVVSFESKPRGTKTVIDMSSMLSKNASSAKRGFLFADDRTSLVIRDEVDLPKASDVYWFMYTKAATQVDGNTVILTDQADPNKQVKLEFVSNTPGKAYTEAAAPLESAPVVTGQSNNDAFTRIVYKLNSKGSINITAKLSTTAYPASPINDYDIPMNDWIIPDGELEPIPTLDKLVINGEEYNTDERFITIPCENESSLVPQIQAESSIYNVEIKYAQTVSEKSYILLSKYDEPDVKYSYTIGYDPKMITRKIDGYEVAEIKSVTATDEPQPDNPAIHVLDGKPSTRWSAEREQSLLLELENAAEIDTYLMSMYSGDTRQTFFDVSVSEDGTSYEKVYSGATSGKTSDYEAYDIGKHTVKYIKVDFHGASSSTWNSVTEVVAATKK